MRDEDISRLDIPVAGAKNAEEVDAMFRRAIDADLPVANALASEIRRDLSPTSFGIGWWSPHPDPPRRILISDHLLLCASGVAINIVEARLHLLELRDARTRWNQEFARRVQDSPSGLTMLAASNVRDELPRALASLHLGGLLRAVGSTLDCLAAVVIGVGALPLNILKADFSKMITYLTAPTRRAGLPRLHQELAETLERAVRTAGPEGWLEWATGYRNMLVHRGRQMNLSKIVPELSRIVRPDGREVVRFQLVSVLPADPGRSEVEVWRDGDRSPFLLSEDASLTVEGIYASTTRLVEDVSASMKDVWLRRRTEPSMIAQPRKQWELLEATRPSGFRGYAPGSLDISIREMHATQEFGLRLLSASLSDPQRTNWIDWMASK
ncbi:MAG TPA: hypothetical protein VFL36_10390 [Myxococcales bacterium]|nr:hypothetical protein [Myxococcales bacterium]